MRNAKHDTELTRWAKALCMTALLSCCSSAVAHGPLHERLARANQTITADPTNATHYVARAELSFEHADFAATLRDLDQADALGQAGEKTTLLRARTLSAQGHHDDAITLATTCVADAVSPQYALTARSEIYEAMGKLAQAAGDLESAIDVSEKPSVDVFLRCAVLQEQAGDGKAARQCLERARAARPQSRVLQVALCDLAIRQGSHEDALNMLDDLITHAPRGERWLVRKAEVLTTMGRRSEAALAAREALTLIDALPPRHRETPVMNTLRQRSQKLVTANTTE
ncbi:MAG: tetratricopeptide repeat protein [Kiritimatiellae bacterium]|nr:tetratricopeptide repeat protein [Kiritimatiellia bacterium]